MTPDFTPQAPDAADRLTKPQAQALLILHPTEGNRCPGLPRSTLKSLRGRLLARSGPMEAEWFLTDFGVATQAVLKERGGMAALG